MDDLIVINRELALQSEEEKKLIAKLIIANNKLAYNNQEKEIRAAELAVANRELAYQNREKEKRAAELAIANKELAYQNEEKEKRAAELAIANKELAYQNREKEKRAAELIAVNEELLSFTYIASHDLQEPLRKIQTFASMILDKEDKALSDTGKDHFQRMQAAAKRMQQLIEDLLAYIHTNTAGYKFEKIDLTLIVNEVRTELIRTIEEKQATIVLASSCYINMIHPQFRRLLYNIVHNALKFSHPAIPPHITINGKDAQGRDLGIDGLLPEERYSHIAVKDNGIGFDPIYSERIFEVFQRLHGQESYAGTGIGLAIAKKIADHHKGIIVATSELNKGATFDIYIPVHNEVLQ